MSNSKKGGVYVTRIPAKFNELVKLYVESEAQGGGKFSSYFYDDEKQYAAVHFVDCEVTERFAERKYIDILSHEMPINKIPSDKTIFVYDIPPSLKEDLDCFLESPRKGGGPIEDINFDDENSCAEVTFKETHVAQDFIDTGFLKINQQKMLITNLPLDLFRPQFKYHLNDDIIRRENISFDKTENDSDRDSCSSSLFNPRSMTPTCVELDDKKDEILLEAFDLSENLTPQCLKLALENKRLGGGKAKDFRFDSTDRVAYFSYEDDETTNRILQKRIINIKEGVSFQVRKLVSVESRAERLRNGSGDRGRNLQTAETRGKSDCVSSTVELQCSCPVNKDQLELYAENKRSGGGKVNSVVEITPQMFIITFASPEAARSFCQTDHSQYLKGKVSTSLLDSWPRNVKPCAIKVKGLKKNTSNDTLRLYFENARSGGQPDCLEDIYPIDGSTACIVFNNSEVVENILQKKQWKVLDANLKIELLEPSRPPPLIDPTVNVESSTLLFTEIKAQSLNKKAFEKFVSLASRAQVKDILFYKQSSKALVYFASEPDYDHVLETLCSRPFQGIMISVQKVPVINSVTVDTFPGLTIDYLKIYFENHRRSGGGEIVNIEKHPKCEAFVIKFANQDVVSQVLSKEHKYNDSVMTVKPFCEECFPTL